MKRASDVVIASLERTELLSEEHLRASAGCVTLSDHDAYLHIELLAQAGVGPAVDAPPSTLVSHFRGSSSGAAAASCPLSPFPRWQSLSQRCGNISCAVRILVPCGPMERSARHWALAVRGMRAGAKPAQSQR